MSNFENYVIIYVPLDNDGKPNKDNPGHYEIMLSGTMTLLDKTYTNPIISYGKMAEDDNRGKIIICNREDRVFAPKQLLCTYDIIATDDPEEKINLWLQNHCIECNNPPQDDIDSGYDVYEATGDYAVYSKPQSNCFMAAAEWCSLLGDTALSAEIAQSGGDYRKYTAWPMFLKHYKGWYFDKLVKTTIHGW